jgi:nucleotide-binding universal stress UspA family protein
MAAQRTIVVGVDGTPGSRAALRHALAEAARRGAELLVVRAFEVPEPWYEGYSVVHPPSASEMTIAIEGRTRVLVRETAEAMGGDAARVPVEVAAVVGAAGPALVDRARGAELLVVGHRGRHAVASALLGSVGLHCVLHAACPVTVVPPEREPRPVAVAP